MKGPGPVKASRVLLRVVISLPSLTKHSEVHGGVYDLTTKDVEGQSRKGGGKMNRVLEEPYYVWGNVLGTLTQNAQHINSMTQLCLLRDEESRA